MILKVSFKQNDSMNMERDKIIKEKSEVQEGNSSERQRLNLPLLIDCDSLGNGKNFNLVNFKSQLSFVRALTADNCFVLLNCKYPTHRVSSCVAKGGQPHDSEKGGSFFWLQQKSQEVLRLTNNEISHLTIQHRETCTQKPQEKKK